MSIKEISKILDEKLPSEIVDSILSIYWQSKFKEDIIDELNIINEKFSSTEHFIMKFIIQDPSRIYSNSHLHYHYIKHNKVFNEVLEDKGKFQFLKINYSHLKFLNRIDQRVTDAYKLIDDNVKNLAIYSVSRSNQMRYVIYHQFKKFSLM